MLRKKLINKRVLMRMATLEGWKGGWEVLGCEAVWRLPSGKSIVYVTRINDEMMEENKLFYRQ